METGRAFTSDSSSIVQACVLITLENASAPSSVFEQ